MKYTNIFSFLVDSVWAIVPSVLERTVLLLPSLSSSSSSLHSRETTHTSVSRIDTLLNQFGVQIERGVARVYLHGALSSRAGIDADCMTIYSYLDLETLMVWFSTHPTIHTVVLDVDSPGGTVMGIQEAVRGIRAYRATGKNLLVYSSGLMCSAAYWLSSFADKVYATPSAVVGSIGVYMMHISHERHLDKEGYAVTIIQAGDYKTEGTPYRDLSAETAERYQEKVEKIYREFLGIVAENRKLAIEAHEQWANGRVFEGGGAAKEVGLVDAVMTPVEFKRELDNLISMTMEQQFLREESVESLQSVLTKVETELREKEEQLAVLSTQLKEAEATIASLERRLAEYEDSVLELKFEALMTTHAGRVNSVQRDKFAEMFSKSKSEATLDLIEGIVSVLPDRASELEAGVSLGQPAPLPTPIAVKSLEEKKQELVELANKRVFIKKDKEALR